MHDSMTGHHVSGWKDFVEILYAPSVVYTRNREAIFWLPLAVVLLLSWMLLILTVPLYQPMLDEMWGAHAAAFVDRYPFATARTLEVERARSERLAPLMVPVILLIMLIGAALVGWLGGKIVGARQTIRSALMVVGFSAIPVVIGMVVMLAELAVRGSAPPQLGWSLARLIEPGTLPEPLMYLLSIDAFFVWASVLFALGLAATGHISRVRAALVVATIWLVVMVPVAAQR